MKKFSRIVENQNQKFYKVEAKIELIIPADNEGEAGYISDSVLAGNEYTSDYTIINIDETDERISESFSSKNKKVILNNKFIEQLSNTPESGMGYHKVDIELENGEILKDKVVTNCSILTLENHIDVKDIKKIKVIN